MLALGTPVRVADKSYHVAGLTQYRDGSGKLYTDYDLARSGKYVLSVEDEQTEWTLTRPLGASRRLIARNADGVTFAGESFALEEEYRLSVHTIVGELEELPTIGASARFAYYESDERGLEVELSAKGEPVEWYLTSEFDPSAVHDPARPRTSAAKNKPASFGEQLVRWAFVFAVGAAAIHLSFAGISRNQTVIDSGPRTVAGESHWESESFVLDGRTSNVLARVRTNLDNQWLHLTLTLTNTETGKWYRRSEDIVYYYGWEGSESWSEGGKSPDLYFSSIPAGEYVLEVEAASDYPVDYGFSLHRDVVRGDYLMYAFGAIFLVPLLYLLKRMED